MSLRRQDYDVVIVGEVNCGQCSRHGVGTSRQSGSGARTVVGLPGPCEGRRVPAVGVAEARRLGLHETLMRAGGTQRSRFVPYDDTLEPARRRGGCGRIGQDPPGRARHSRRGASGRVRGAYGGGGDRRGCYATSQILTCISGALRSCGIGWMELSIRPRAAWESALMGSIGRIEAQLTCSARLPSHPSSRFCPRYSSAPLS